MPTRISEPAHKAAVGCDTSWTYLRELLAPMLWYVTGQTVEQKSVLPGNCYVIFQTVDALSFGCLFEPSEENYQGVRVV